MDDCIFCKIVAGKIPKYQIYEDDNFIGFLDINPLSMGNSLLIPKIHYRWVYDVPEFGLYWEASKKIAEASIKALNADSVSFLTIGYEVPHAHIRIIPRFLNNIHQNGLDLSHHEKYTPHEMTEISQKIINFLNK
ncbi:MAG: HIT domain-containing protein [Candidatus Shapirobacteria bacterium]|nr:HIT domain-containing protein [Candidatus Shapirobacteria bacterium]